MAYKCGNKMQSTFLPPIIDDYVTDKDPVRVYDALVDSLSLKSLGISLIPGNGADEYHPKTMLKLLIYGYSYGIRSGRKLERACHHNLSFQWIMAGLKPDHRTISRFRSKHKDAISKVLKQCVRICMDLDILDGNTLFVDGSKFRANASINNTWNKEKCEKYLKKTDERIDQLLNECETLDAQEDKEASMVLLKKKIQGKENLVTKIKKILTTLEETNKKSINTVDPDAVKAKGRQGTHATHNVQMVTDKKHGLIVHAEAVSQANDSNQLNPQLNNAIENIEKKPENVVADSGYASTQDLKRIDSDIKVVVPSQKQAQKNNDRYPVKEFDKEQFIYDKEKNQYTCPEDKPLKYRSNSDGKYYYRAKKEDCEQCPNYGICTKAKNGRSIARLEDEEIKEQFEAIYASPEGQDIYKFRKQKAELPFGHMKRNLSAGQFMLRSQPKVNAEISILSTCFNIARMITIFGIPRLILELNGG